MDRSAAFGSPNGWLELGHCRLPHWRVGDGPDVVLIHGWPLDSRTWRAIVPRLAQRYTCHLIDMPGAGQSEWDGDTPIGLAEGGQTLRQAIDAMGLQAYALVGHDSGAVFARLCAADDPDRVRALVLGNTEIPGHEPWLLKLMTGAHKIPGAVAAWFRLLRLGPIQRSIFGYGSCFADVAFLEGAFSDLFVHPLLHDSRVRAGHIKLAANLDFDVVHSLEAAHARIQAPVRFIWGVSDPYFPLDKARAMPSQCGGAADLVTIDPGKLFAHEEFPETFLDYAEPTLAAGFSSSGAAD